MIYSASLSLHVKKAFAEKATQSSVAKISSLLNEDPAISTMDTVVLGPKDAVGPKGKAFVRAIPKAHPSICFIYIYSKSGEEGLFNIENKVQLKKVNAQTVKEAVNDVLRDHTIREGKARVSSADFEAPSPDMDFGDFMPGDDEEETPEYVQTTFSEEEEPLARPQTNFTAPSGMEEEVTDDDIPLPDLLDDDGTVEEETPVVDEEAKPKYNLDFADNPPQLPEEPLQSGNAHIEPVPVDMPRVSLEDAINNVASMEDWEIFKQSLHKESIYKRLIEENTTFQGLINMIETLDYRINSVWRDTSLSAEAKFDKIKEIGLERSVAVATANSITAEKVINIINKTMLAAKRTVEERLSSYDKAMYTVTTSRVKMNDMSQINKAIEERTKVQMDLLGMVRKIIDLYKMTDRLVTEEIQELDANLPSSNEFINNMVKPIGTQIFTPKNTAELANRLMKALQDSVLTASQLESKVKATISLMFSLFEKDTEIIDSMQEYITMMQANRVEDVVIVDSVLKNMLRVFTGAEGTGRTATAITWCGVLSRRQNCLLLDLTGKAKFAEYGVESVSLEDFMTNRIKKQFCCVESERILRPDELQKVVEEMKTRLDYYPYVNVIMDPDDYEGLAQISSDALCIHYICNCTTPSMEKMRVTIQKHTSPNIARKLVLIDPPVSPLSIADTMDVDPTIFKLIILPNIPDIRACAIQHDRPFEYEHVIRIFEEAFS